MKRVFRGCTSGPELGSGGHRDSNFLLLTHKATVSASVGHFHKREADISTVLSSYETKFVGCTFPDIPEVLVGIIIRSTIWEPYF